MNRRERDFLTKRHSTPDDAIMTIVLLAYNYFCGNKFTKAGWVCGPEIKPYRGGFRAYGRVFVEKVS